MPHASSAPDSAAMAAAPTGPVLVTGANGFAGRHLVDLLEREERRALAPPRSELDLLDPDAVCRLMAESKPSAVFHLAAFSSPRKSLDRPAEALTDNISMTLNLLEAARLEAPGARVLLVSSGQVYGDPDRRPIDEQTPLEPRNPYAVSKAAGDLLGQQYAAVHGLAVIRARPFNHAGPGQSDEYVVGTLARQVAEAELAGADEAVLHTGDVSVARDFTDVRDVVRAYTLLAERAEPGSYNVCSGRCTRIGDLLDTLAEHARIPVRHEVDPSRLRADDTLEIFGSCERLRQSTGWEAEVELSQTMADTLDYWRDRLAR